MSAGDASPGRTAGLTHADADWAGLRVVVAGLGVSGFAAADALLQRGAAVVAVDDRDGPAEREAAELVSVLGGTAVLALTGKNIPIVRARGPAQFLDGVPGYITVHPSYLLRLPDEAAKRQAFAVFVEDLKRIRSLAENDNSRLSAAR